jgi:2-polyprenyl-6-methoxyphenol hydroxylase-like FAD-dependent oxidoreductase
MRIAIIGGGPAGLYAALLLKRLSCSHSITLFERGAPDETYGWGVVFSSRALELVAQTSADVHQALNAPLETWPDLHIGHRDQIVSIDGSGFAGIARLELLRVLHQFCQECEVDLRYGEEVEVQNLRTDYDLVIAADGVNSRSRGALAEALRPTRRWCTNRYIWFGVEKAFDALSLLFRTNEQGSFVAHTYRYSPQMSTFIVECDASTFKASGLPGLSDDDGRQYCERVFESDLNGCHLLSNQSQWLQFPVQNCERWVDDNVVLIGDAARTVHFSIGSGTRTALEDAIFLSRAIEENDSVSAALEHYQATRRTSAARISALAESSLNWYENFASVMHLAPHELAMHYMTRGTRIDLERLRQHAPAFVAAYESASSRTAMGSSPATR